MRFLRVLPAAFLAVLIATSAYAQSGGYVDGTDHDLRTRLSISQVCLPCHAPHNARSATAGPIFNHALTTVNFVRHGEAQTLTGSSKLCMSCHDGVTAVGNYGSITTSTDKISGGAALGGDLTDDHPIGVDYLEVFASHGSIFKDPNDVAGYLEDDRVECGSCHRAHGGLEGKFLRVTTTGSAICRVCHKF